MVEEKDPGTRACCDVFEIYSGQDEWQRGQWIDTLARVYELPIAKQTVRCYQRHEDNLNLGITGGTVWDGAVVSMFNNDFVFKYNAQEATPVTAYSPLRCCRSL